MNKIRLEKGIVHLMLPFRFDSKLSFDTTFETSIWTKAGVESVRLDFLLEHVKEFFTKNLLEKKEDESACYIMKLKNDSLPVKMFNNKIYWLSNKPFDEPQKSKKLLNVPVYFDPGAFRLIYHPFSSVAILLYSVELIKPGNSSDLPILADFIRMNYLLRLFNRHDEAFFISQNERVEERSKAALLLKDRTPSIFSKTESGNVETAGWRPSQLINYLLYNLNTNNKVKFFDHFHFVPVCYLQQFDKIESEEIIHQALFFLSKVYDFDYTPSSSLLQIKKELLHPYKQIYYAASLEGVVVLNNSNVSDPEFIRTFYSNSFKNTLWLAILGLMQRTIFLQLLKEVSDVDPDDNLKIKEYLRRYTRISLSAIFSKVSVYHQHNDFYDLIIHQLQINELQIELKDELYGLNNLQRQFHEDEMERHEAIEKLGEKKLNMILFALSVFSLAQVTYIIFGGPTISLFRHLLAIGIPIILGVVFWQILTFRRK